MDLSGSAVADSLCGIKHFKVFKMKDIVDCFWKTNASKTNLPDIKEVDSIRSLVSCLPPFSLKSINHYNIENRIMGSKKWHSEYGCCPLLFLGRLLNSLTVLFLEPAPIANIFCITFKRPFKKNKGKCQSILFYFSIYLQCATRKGRSSFFCL